MFGPPRPPIYPNMEWNCFRPPHNFRWGRPSVPRASFHRISNQDRLQFQPGNDNYWCETCDRGFANQDILNKHKQQHEKCNIDGCQFVAHPKVITKHIQMQHSSGLYKKIANLHKPEEIEKWREERRKRYPTKTNIDKRVAELKEKIDRGEKMGLDRSKNHFNKGSSGYNSDNKSGHGLKRNNDTRNKYEPRSKSTRRNTSDSIHNKKPQPKPIPKIPTVEEYRKLTPFAGISYLEMESEDEVEEVTCKLFDLVDDLEEPKSIEEKPIDIGEPTVCGALSSLMCDYGSTDEEDNLSTNNSMKSTEKTTENIIYDDKIDNFGDKKYNKDIVRNVIKEDISKVTQNENKTRDMTQEPLQNFVKSINVPFQNCDGKEDITAIFKNDTVTDNVQHLNKNSNSILLQNSHQVTETIIDKRVTTEETIHQADLNKINNIASVQDLVKDQSVNDDSDSGPDEVKIDKNKDTTVIPPIELAKPNNVVVRKKTMHEKKIFRRTKPKLPSTLLQKLLNKEMQQERNIVLQCIRYIRRNNYLETNK